MAQCRVCGAECGEHELLPVQHGGGCRSCNGSPACARCGHPRRQHSGTFGGGEPGCKAKVAADVGLAWGRCGCAGYTADAAAFMESTAIVELRLRGPDEPAPVDARPSVPAPDMLDESRRPGGPSELDGVPWRPPR